MLQASCLRLTCLQQKWASHKMGAARPPRGKTPKIKVLKPKISILGPKNVLLPAFALFAARKVTKLQTAGKKVNCSLCLRLQAKTAQKMENQFSNREIDYAKGYLWSLSWFWSGVNS